MSSNLFLGDSESMYSMSATRSLARSPPSRVLLGRPRTHAFLLLRNPPYSIYSQARAPPPRRRSSQVPVARECRLLSERTKRATRWS